MNRVNLLPPEILEQEAMRERTRRFILVSVAVLAIFAVIFLTLLSMTLVVKGQVAGIKAERVKIQKQAEGYGAYTRLQNQLESTNALVKQLLGNSVDWKLLTGYVQTSVPPGVWLTDMTLSGNSIDMKGMSYSPGVIATWVDNLNKNPVIKSVSFKKLDESSANASANVDKEATTAFELKVTFDRAAVKLEIGQGEV